MTIRWFVEVSPVEASPLKERYCVDALQWQQALQQARKIRGDRGPMARFAMELLEVGYRATDPTSRLRYTVSKAPADAPLSARPPALNRKSNGNGNGNGKTAHRMPSDPEIEELSNPMLVALPPPLETNYEDALPTMPRASERPPKAEPVSYETRPPEAIRSGSVRPSQIPLPGRKSRSRNVQTSPAVPRPNRSHPPPVEAVGVHAAGSAAPNLSTAPVEEPVPTLPGLTLLSQRREEPTEAVPILYREYAMAFDSNLTPRELERYARAVWEQVRTSIGHRPPGKFVQVALFDHRFTGKPERAPAAVLAWKDWRGDPVIRIRQTKAPAVAVPPEGETAKAGAVALRADTLDSGWPLDSTSSLPPGAPESVPSSGPSVSVQSAPSDVVRAVQEAAREAEETSAPIDLTAMKRAEAEAVVVEAEPLEPSSPEASPVLVEAEPLETSAPPTAAVSAAPVLQIVPEIAIEKSDVAAAAALEATPLSAEESAAPPGSFPAPPPGPSIPVLPPPVPPPLEAKEPAAAVAVDVASAVAVDAAPPAPLASQPAQLKLGRTPAPRSSGNAVRRRGSSEDLIGELFEEMHELHFMPDIVSGADYVLSCVLFMLPCEGALIHVFDINAREFVVVRAAGPAFRDALLIKTPDTYPLFREAFRRATALSFPNVEGDERFTAERFQRLGVQVKSALCGAVQHGGRYLGIIELVNPLGGEPYRVSEVNALDYICEQFADFVASRPIVLDEDVILGGS